MGNCGSWRKYMTAALPIGKPKRSAGRMRITNGTDLLPHVDGRSVWARLMRDTLDMMVAHCGGADVIPDTKRLTARRIAALETELIYLEDKFARIRRDGAEPHPNDLDLYGRLANGQRRHLEAIGMERQAREIQGIREILDERARS
jgi:hypothetical protein